MKKHNLFITLEGGEGTGKTTVSNLLKEKFNSIQFDIFLTREPGGSGLKFVEDIRKLIMSNKDITTETELFLFLASRIEHISKKILPALINGKMVICDRFIDSTYVYQGTVKGLDLQVIELLNNIAIGDLIPDLTFILDLDPKIAIKRIENNGRAKNRFDNESIEFHERIRKAYIDLSKKDKNRYIVTDASKKPEEIASFIYNKILNFIKQRDISKTYKTIEIRNSFQNLEKKKNVHSNKK